MAIRFVDEHELEADEKPCELHHGDDVLECKMRKCPDTGDVHVCPDAGFNVELPIGEQVTLKMTDGSGSEYHGSIDEDKCLRTR